MKDTGSGEMTECRSVFVKSKFKNSWHIQVIAVQFFSHMFTVNVMVTLRVCFCKCC